MRVLTVTPFLLACACSAALLVIPWYASGETVLEVSGQIVLIPLAIPVLAALLPILFPRRAVRIGATAVLAGFALLGSFSIGLFFAPSAVLMMVASRADRQARGHR